MSLTLREWRLAREISQEKMAEHLNIHVGTYINWEKAPGKIPFEKAVDIAGLLGVSLDDISFTAKELVNER